jgi:hypothetical protein
VKGDKGNESAQVSLNSFTAPAIAPFADCVKSLQRFENGRSQDEEN